MSVKLSADDHAIDTADLFSVIVMPGGGGTIPLEFLPKHAYIYGHVSADDLLALKAARRIDAACPEVSGSWILELAKDTGWVELALDLPALPR